MIDSQRARTKLFKSRKFRDEVTERIGHPAQRVAACFDALLESERIPHVDSNNAAALAADGALFLSAIASQQMEPVSIVRVTDRICRMEFQLDVGQPATDGPLGQAMQGLPSTAFSSDLGALFRNIWSASRGKSAWGFHPTAVSVFWSDERGQMLFGTIEQPSKRRKRIYSSAPMNAPQGLGNWDFVQLPTVGGSVFSSLPVLGFVELLDLGVEDGAASLDAFV